MKKAKRETFNLTICGDGNVMVTFKKKNGKRVKKFVEPRFMLNAIADHLRPDVKRMIDEE